MMDPPECSGHSHDHDHEDSLGLSLRQYIDFTKVRCLNENIQGSGRSVLKLHEDRLTDTPSLLSAEGDPELLLFIPFSEGVSVQSISVRTGCTLPNTSPPRKIKLFVDRNDLDFEIAHELPAQQEFELIHPLHFSEGTIDYPLRPVGRFQNISSLTIFFVNNFDGHEDTSTCITYVGVKGKGTNTRHGIVNTVYESQGMLKDHKVPDEKGAYIL